MSLTTDSSAPAATGDGAARRAEFRSFVRDVVTPHADDYDREQIIPDEVLKQVAEAGYWGPTLPRSFGGSEMDMLTLGALHEEVGRGCSSLRSLLTVHSMVLSAVQNWAEEEIQAKWLPSLASGELRAAFCLTEPEIGSDAGSVRTEADQQDDHYLLSGTKRWITGGQIADVFLVFASTAHGVAAFLVPADTPGVVREPIWDVLGTRASMLAEVRFDQVRVPAANLIGMPGFGTIVMTSALDMGRYSVASGCVGILQGCLDESVAYTAAREQGGSPIREHQLVRKMISDMVTRVRSARLLCEQAGRLKDAGDPETIMATWIAKYYASTSAMQVASDAVQLHGANGCSGLSTVNRLFRDAKIMEIIEGSSEIQQLTIAEDAYRAQSTAGAR